MSMIEAVEADIAYKCDICGERFNSEDEVPNHNQKVHPVPVLNDDSDRGL